MSEAATVFRRLHDGPHPFRLVNAWDAVSARVLALAGAPAIGTSSFAVALAHGYPDGEQIPWSTVCETVRNIVGAVDVPVSVDIEAGRGENPTIEQAVRDVVDAGAVGVNLEDGRHDEPGRLFDTGEQCVRLAAARAAGGADLFVNARCDVFFGAALDTPDLLGEAIARATSYLAAGADGIFLPGLVDLAAIQHVTNEVPAPLNVMLWPGLPPYEQLAAAGVRRISQGGAPFLATIGHLERITKAYLEGEPADFSGDSPPAYHLVSQLAHR